ncbi:hypothetical protein MMC31_003871 [Peltigera leucophlebia]|nr:hypothetical protein [Peltigera leucophlebia]
MFSNGIFVRRGFFISSIINTSSKTKLLTRVYLSTYTSTASKLPDEFSEEDHIDARNWLNRFNIDTIPRSLGHVSFSRSSGPGGQNVNKVNSKATVRFRMSELLAATPAILHSPLRASKYFAGKSNSLVIQADGSRRQADNVQECFQKLKLLIESAGKSVIMGETTPEKMAKVRQL